MYKVQSQEFGPVSAAELKQLAKVGTLTPTDHVRPELIPKWSLASNVKGLFPEIELELDDSPASSSDENSVVAVPPPLLSSIAVVPPLPVAQRPYNVPIAATVEPLSHSATTLKSVVSDTVWRRLVQLQLPVGDELFWTRLSAFRSRRKEASLKDAEAKNFWQRASEKISSLAESAEIQTNRYLVVSSDGRSWVTNQLAAVGEAWNIPMAQYKVSCHWNAYELTVNLETISQELEVELAQYKIDLSRDQANRCHGSPNDVIALANAGPPEIPADLWTCFPLVSQVTPARLGSFFNRADAPGRIGIAAVNDSAIVFGNDSKAVTLPFANIVGWRKGDGYLLCIHDTGNQLQHVSITTSGAVATVDDLAEFVAKIAEATKAAESAKNVTAADSPLEKKAETTLQTSTSCEPGPTMASADGIAHPRHALDTISKSLRRESTDKFCEHQMLAAEFSATPLFKTQRKRLMIVCRDSDVQVAVAEPNELLWQPLDSPYLHSFMDRWFVEASSGEVFELLVDKENEPIVAAMKYLLQSMYPNAKNACTLALLTPTNDETADWNIAIPFRIRFEDHGTLQFEASVESQSVGTFTCTSDAVSRKSRLWNDQFVIANVTVPGSDVPMQLASPPETLVRIWETRELTNLRTRTKGITLGEMYAQYNEMRNRKFVTGIFGNYFLAQQRLELRSPLDAFINQIELTPPGVLQEQLELELIERLSVLEISRHQLNRWLDRCTLMYPHQQADTTRRWLEDAFGKDVVSYEDRDREAWKVHQQTRAELRQVQASMNRAMAEVGQNLNAISFAFPEEVRCEALAATRRAASMAGKGAMVAAFAGMGGQMLMGLGRASVGDPMGVALLGTVGMSMLGRHLEKNAMDTEKKLRLRAYGTQALQWWKVVLETASVMALESRHTIEQSQKSAMLRDRKILESLPREQLPQTQKRMASTMLAMMQEEVDNQFYEALPGSGVFGWHIVDHMSEVTSTQPKVVLKRFSGEVPGSLAIGVKDGR